VAFAAGLGAYGARNVCRTIVTTAKIGRLHNARKSLADASEEHEGRGDNRETAALAKVLGNLMKDELSPEVIERIEQNNGHLKLMSDVPLELLPVDGVPLAIRTECSRIPVTPGDLFLDLTLAPPPCVLRSSDFQRITIIRSFSPNDPVADALTQEIDWLQQPITEDMFRQDASGADILQRTGLSPGQPLLGKKVKIDWKDAESTDDFREALNSCDSTVVVFDGHGVVDSDGEGYLLIGDQRVRLANILQTYKAIPPVWILLSCSTASVNGGEKNPVYDLLHAGAVTVLGATAPIGASYAAELLASLLLLLDSDMSGNDDKIGDHWRTWSNLVHRVLQRKYVKELLDQLSNAFKVEVYREQAMPLFEKIFHLTEARENWFSEFVSLSSTLFKVPESDVENAIQQRGYYCDSARLVQFGHPDLVRIFPACG
jgi:hypothetical protein